MFDAFLRKEFEDKPGKDRVLKRQYLLLDGNNENVTIDAQEWPQVVFPGTRIVMSILMERIRFLKPEGGCPKPGCVGIGCSSVAHPSFLVWSVMNSILLGSLLTVKAIVAIYDSTWMAIHTKKSRLYRTAHILGCLVLNRKLIHALDDQNTELGRTHTIRMMKITN
jgi:hypothetical protein